MPYMCSVTGCRGNYKDGPKVHAFKFPNKIDVCKAWVTAVGGPNFIPTKYSRVCELHFPKDKIINSSTAKDSRTGQTITIDLTIPRLAPDAVPVLFPDCPKSPSNSIITRITGEPNYEIGLHKESVCFNNYDGLVAILGSIEVPPHWNKLVCDEKVMFLKLTESPGPVITYSVVINNMLEVKTFLRGQQISVAVTRSQMKRTTPFVSYNIQEIKDLLCEVDKCNELDKSNLHENNSDHVLRHVSNKIDTLIHQNSENEHSNNNNVLSFISEQIKMLMSSKERYQYSNNTLIVASILHAASSYAYNFLRLANICILPHPNTIKSLFGSLLTDSKFDEKRICLNYAKHIFRVLTENDKHVILLFEEIHFNPYASDNTSVAKSIFVITLTSVNSSFKKVVYICPILENDHKIIFSLLNTVIIKLEEIGYKIFCVVSNNNEVNRNAMGHFITSDEFSTVYAHPVDKSRPLFYLFNAVDLLRSIRCDWLNSKPDQSLHYPNFETGIEKVASLRSLKELCRLEHEMSVKDGCSLNLKALLPTNVEYENEALPLKIFNPSVVQALTEFGSNIDNWKETADFINIMLTWWKIVSVNTPRKNLNDVYQEPITSVNMVDDKKIVFLEIMLEWLNNWKQDEFCNTLTPETHTALTHSIHGIIEIIKYCLNELHLNCILLGKFQTDDLEHRFGRYRLLSSNHYHISMRQLYESEKGFGIQSLLTLNSQTFGIIKIKRFIDIAASDSIYNLSVDEKDVSSFNPTFTITEDELDIQDDLPILTYLAGYCCHLILKKFQCDFCEQNLIYTDEMVVENNYNLIRNPGNGNVLLPKEFSVQVVCFSYIIFKKIISDFEEGFSFINKKRQYLTEFIYKYIAESGYLCNFPECSNLSNHTTENITKLIITSASNILVRNYCCKTNMLNKTDNKRKFDALNS